MKTVFRFFASKKLLNTLIIVFQLLLFAGVFIWFNEYYPYFWALYVLADILLILWEVNREESADFKIVWVLLIALMPIAGALMYLYLHTDFASRRLARKVELEVSRSKAFLRQDDEVKRHMEEDKTVDRGIFRYIQQVAGYPIWQNTCLQYYPLGDDFFPAFVDALEQAEEFIFMEFFIIDEGRMWDTVHTILKRKVKQGVEVRLFYDGMGTMGLLPSDYAKTLREEGIDCRIFSPVRPFLSTYQNNRDHRKICVIDGHIGFTGGVNLADEYINEKARFGHWKDTAIMLRGDAVKNFTLMFLQMWNVGKWKPEDYSVYLKPTAFTAPSNSFIAPFGDAPLDKEQVGKEVYIHMLNTAKEYVHIMTPYLTPDTDLLSALKFAAKRGVSVKILMPHVPDKWYAFAIAHAYYPELIRSGVQIYEYDPGFVHAKVTVSDDEKAVVGSINYDFRSLYLHYECGTYIYRDPVIDDIEADFQKTLEQSRAVTLSSWKRLGVFHRLFGWVFRVLAPLV